jgi:endonuclease/exonuclease/phosphatase family metal-dependent hydrolase
MIIKLLQWNILYKENIDNIIIELIRINPDIVCVQELWFEKGSNAVIEKLKNLYPYIDYAVAHTIEGVGSQCNAILSKYPLINSLHKYVQEPSEEKGNYSKEGRIYVEDRVKINDTYLDVGTVHLSYVHRFENNDAKDKEVNNLLELLKKHSDKYVFTGDLNFNRDSYYVDKIKEELKYYETGNTWATKPFSYNGFEETELNWKLDHVFSTNDINVEKIEVINTEYSDHLPILVEINLK